jgi:hypothetical protein
MMHKQVGFELREIRMGAWAYEYAISAQIKKGEVFADSRAVAVRKIQQLIGRDLRIRHIERRGGIFRDASPPVS